MWAEAFRVCKQYAPHLTNQLQEDFTVFDSRNDSAKEPEELIEQAKQFERQGEYRKAIERYLQLTPQIMDNDIVLAKCWTRAADLAAKFLLKEHADYVLKSLAPMLSSISRFAEAASLYVQCGQYKEAIRALIEGDLWDEARRLATEVGPKYVLYILNIWSVNYLMFLYFRMEEYVKMKQTESLKASGQIEQLEGVNAVAALELLCEQGQWGKCLERAKQNPDTLSKYMGKYVTHLIKSNSTRDALKVYMDYGTPCNREHFSLYRALAIILLTDINMEDFETWSELRNTMYSVVNALNSSGADRRSNVYQQMESFLWVSHYYVNKLVFQALPSLEQLAAKTSVSLLRYCGLVPVERAFYEAGILCRVKKPK
jgi:intraflagellar transport protein 172